MDIFCEFLVKKKSASDNIKRISLVLLCIIVCILILYIGFSVYRALVSFVPILIAAAIYGTVIYGRNFSLEYEYSFTNGCLDIDIIKGRARRQNLVSVYCRKIEYMGPVSEIKPSERRVINAIYDMKRPGKYIVTFSNNGEMCDLYFQPPEKLLVSMQKYNPRNINI